MPTATLCRWTILVGNESYNQILALDTVAIGYIVAHELFARDYISMRIVTQSLVELIHYRARKRAICHNKVMIWRSKIEV